MPDWGPAGIINFRQPDKCSLVRLEHETDAVARCAQVTLRLHVAHVVSSTCNAWEEISEDECRVLRGLVVSVEDEGRHIAIRQMTRPLHQRRQPRIGTKVATPLLRAGVNAEGGVAIGILVNGDRLVVHEDVFDVLVAQADIVGRHQQRGEHAPHRHVGLRLDKREPWVA